MRWSLNQLQRHARAHATTADLARAIPRRTVALHLSNTKLCTCQKVPPARKQKRWNFINSQNRHEMGHQSSACAQQFQRTKKLTADSLRFANNVHLTGRFNHGSNSSSRLAKSRFGKARPRTYCCQPCRQSRSRHVLFTVANLI